MKLEEYFKQYEAAHRNPGNKLFHALGIPLIIISLVLLIFTDYQNIGWIMFAVGWVFQFIGHALERTWPEFLKNPIFLVIGPLYFLNKLTKKSKP